jgi:hypothetical protein
VVANYGQASSLFEKTREARERKQTKASEVGEGVAKVGAVNWRQQQRGRQRKGEGQADREAFPAQGLPATSLSLRSRSAVPLLFSTFVPAVTQQNSIQLRDFFEASLVAENGWELESRLFGMCPHINDTDLSKSYWYTWPTYEGLSEGHDLDLIGRHVWKLPKRKSNYPFDRNFAVKLVSNTFWDHDYVKHGALALIPQVI